MKKLNVEKVSNTIGGGWVSWVSCGLSVAGVIGSAMSVTSPAAMAAIIFLRVSIISAEISCGEAIFG